MNACEDNLMLGRYHDGELPAAQAQAVEAHLLTCPACAAELAQMRAISGALRAADLPRAKPQFVRQLETIGARQMDALRIVSFAYRLTAAAAAVFLLAAGYATLDHRAPVSPPQSRADLVWESYINRETKPAVAVDAVASNASIHGEPQVESLFLQDYSVGGGQ